MTSVKPIAFKDYAERRWKEIQDQETVKRCKNSFNHYFSGAEVPVRNAQITAIWSTTSKNCSAAR